MIRFLYPTVDHMNNVDMGCFVAVNELNKKDIFELHKYDFAVPSELLDLNIIKYIVDSIVNENKYKKSKECFQYTFNTIPGTSMGLSYLLSSVNCFLPTYWDDRDESVDILCTGEISRYDNKPCLDTVWQNQFDEKISYFIGQDDYNIFIIPEMNLEAASFKVKKEKKIPLKRHLIDNNIKILSLTEFQESIKNILNKKIVLTVSRLELFDLIYTLFPLADDSKKDLKKVDSIIEEQELQLKVGEAINEGEYENIKIRSNYEKLLVFDIFPKPIKKIFSFFGVDDKYLHTLKILTFTPSNLLTESEEHISRPLEFLTVSIFINTIFIVLIHLLINLFEIQVNYTVWHSLFIWFMLYVFNFIIGFISIHIDLLYLSFYRTKKSITFPYRRWLAKMLYITGWLYFFLIPYNCIFPFFEFWETGIYWLFSLGQFVIILNLFDLDLRKMAIYNYDLICFMLLFSIGSLLLDILPYGYIIYSLLTWNIITYRFIKKHKMGSVLFDFGKTIRNNIYVFWGIFFLILFFNASIELNNQKNFDITIDELSRCFTWLSFAILILYSGISRIQIREKGILKSNVPTFWKQMKDYQWEEQNIDVTRIKINRKSPFIRDLYLSIPISQQKIIDDILHKNGVLRAN